FGTLAAYVFRVHADDWGPRFLSTENVFAPFSTVLMLSALRIGLATLLTAGALLLALIPLLRSTSSAFCTTALGALALLDIVAAHKTLNRTTTPDFFRYRPPIVDALLPQNFRRIHVREYALYDQADPAFDRSRFHVEGRGMDPDTYVIAKALALVASLRPPVAGRWNLESSYDWDMLGLYSKSLRTLVERLQSIEGTPGYRQLLRVGAVSEVVSLQPLRDLPPIATYPSLFPEPVHLLKVPDPLPRCYAVPASRIVGDDDALGLLADPSFDPQAEVLLDSGTPAAPNPAFHATCALQELAADHVRAVASLSHAGYLVFVDTYDPGWHVTVDQNPAPLLRANVAFRAVPLSPGIHTVELRYRPWSILLGAAISLTSLLAAACALLCVRAIT
ncbi:MAG TPA: YfhO family protein, partial [Vicinamibacteria bacterium]|nr:YfhO family protein [Vicinamibacteria bacterium]